MCTRRWKEEIEKSDACTSQATTSVSLFFICKDEMNAIIYLLDRKKEASNNKKQQQSLKVFRLLLYVFSLK
jgi:hypothetical protein